jgi:NRAMP (natural resistance-associated macrophage protein)-like metal ion transporter
MKKALEITLGIVTSVGGFVDAGSFATSLQAGARHGFRLMWAVGLGTLCVIFLTEMSGRLALMSKHPVRELIHKRFGLRYSAALLLGCLILDQLVLASEIGGVAMAAQLVTGVAFRWWALPAALAVWALLWFLTFGVMEKAISIAGLVTLAFVVAAFRAHAAPPSGGLLPAWPEGQSARYGFLAVSIIGATIMPSMLFFYSSGAIEEQWDRGYLWVNRAVAALGMAFGAGIALAIMAASAALLMP